MAPRDSPECCTNHGYTKMSGAFVRSEACSSHDSEVGSARPWYGRSAHCRKNVGSACVAPAMKTSQAGRWQEKPPTATMTASRTAHISHALSASAGAAGTTLASWASSLSSIASGPAAASLPPIACAGGALAPPRPTTDAWAAATLLRNRMGQPRRFPRQPARKAGAAGESAPPGPCGAFRARSRASSLPIMPRRDPAHTVQLTTSVHGSRNHAELRASWVPSCFWCTMPPRPVAAAYRKSSALTRARSGASSSPPEWRISDSPWAAQIAATM
mmetsp:Transcript_14511/g.31543  ORF Transcript_14511/g.31543 Transcript_14511/m.31543 type:complete len:273 (-) Transcript_14511:406-1224(-)